MAVGGPAQAAGSGQTPARAAGSGKVTARAAGRASVLAALGAVTVRPSLWPTALRQARRLAPTRWWVRPPFLPLPARSYLRFRLVTQYGDPTHRPEADDVVRYLRWCRDWRAVQP